MESRALKTKSDIENSVSASNDKFGVKPKSVSNSRNLTSTKKAGDVKNSNLSVKRKGIRSSSLSPPAKKLASSMMSNIALKRHATTPSVLCARKTEATKSGLENRTETSTMKDKSTVRVIDPKPSKWDWKGRLELTNKQCSRVKKDLAEVEEKLKETEKNLQKESESSWQLKYDEYLKEAGDLKAKVNAMNELFQKEEKENRELMAKLREMEKLNEETNASLKEYQDKEVNNVVALENIEKDIEKKKLLLKSNSKIIIEMENDVDELKNCAFDVHSEISSLHNVVHNLKGNVRIFCRVRPKLEHEMKQCLCSISYLDECVLSISKNSSPECSISSRIKSNRKEFTFDKVFPPSVPQIELFEELVPFVQSALSGNNVCLFFYGPSNSGTTYTFEGTPETEEKGMLYRMTENIFEEKTKLELMGWNYKVKVSFIEIRNDNLQYLNSNLDIYSETIFAKDTNCPEDLFKMFSIAKQNRQDKWSHFIIQFQIDGNYISKHQYLSGVLNLVEIDIIDSNSVIFKSQDILEKVTLCLVRKQLDKVPFEDCKLTQFLKPYLTENTKILFLLNIPPTEENFTESVNLMKFGNNLTNNRLSQIKKLKSI